MSLLLSSENIRLPYREPFRIARAHGGDGMSSVIVELRNEAWPDLVGYGEGYPDAYYGETLETIGVVLPLLLASITADDLEFNAAGAVAVLLWRGWLKLGDKERSLLQLWGMMPAEEINFLDIPRTGSEEPTKDDGAGGSAGNTPAFLWKPNTQEKKPLPPIDLD